MSKVLTYNSSGNVGPSNGARVSSFTLTSGSQASSLVLTDTAGTTIAVAAPANQSFEWFAGDSEQGAEFFGQIVATLTGNSAQFSIEYL